ncbi:MAG: hypothetical protein JWM68_1912 [Verrucomicrobiales bacterium]|nr:hypothetical protein [Verrucomicrobiales bacterium]
MKKMRTVIVIVTAMLAVTPITLVQAHDGEKQNKEDKQAAETRSTAKRPKPYPLNTCLVSDDKLGKHGKSYVFTHKGQEIKLCCKDCLSDFKKNTEKYLKKINDAGKKN